MWRQPSNLKSRLFKLLGCFLFGMIYRFKSKEVLDALQHFPALAILGPRQVGKTTLAKSMVLVGRDIVWLDLEKESDRFKLQNVHDYLRGLEDSCVVLD